MCVVKYSALTNFYRRTDKVIPSDPDHKIRHKAKKDFRCGQCTNVVKGGEKFDIFILMKQV